MERVKNWHIFDRPIPISLSDIASDIYNNNNNNFFKRGYSHHVKWFSGRSFITKRN